MRRFVLILSTAFCLLACQGNAGVSSENSGKGGNPTRPTEAGGVQYAAITDFGFKLFNELVPAYDDQNLFISPASVAIALAMTYNGAAGATADAMTAGLSLDGMDRGEINTAFADLLTLLANPDSAVELSIANSLWARQGLPFKEDFLQRNTEYYRAEISALDFSSQDAAPTINKWVNDQTRGKISGIVDPPIDPSAILFLINAIYFKGEWTYAFNDTLTEDGAFYLLDGSAKQHPQMHQSGDYAYLENDQFQSVRLPYGKNERLAMYLFLPRAESSLKDLEGTLTADNWSAWMEEFRMMEGDIALPRFRLEFNATLNDALIALGMGTAFDPSAADFRDMFPTSASANVYISKVKHKTFVEVNEQGTEAAAVTSVEMALTEATPGPPQRFSMIVDRPFFFAIRDDQTGTVLFMGSIVEPM